MTEMKLEFGHTLNPWSLRHCLWASMRSLQFSSPLWTIHSSLSFLVSGQTQHGFSFFFSLQGRENRFSMLHCSTEGWCNPGTVAHTGKKVNLCIIFLDHSLNALNGSWSYLFSEAGASGVAVCGLLDIFTVKLQCTYSMAIAGSEVGKLLNWNSHTSYRIFNLIPR